MPQQLNLYLADTDPLLSWLTARADEQSSGGRGKRGGLAHAAYAALNAHRALVARALTSVQLTDGEMLALASILNGSLLDADTISGPILAAEVEDAEPAQIAAWGVVPDVLAMHCHDLTPIQAWAVYDLIVAAWKRDEDQFAARLRAAGWRGE